MLTSEELLRPRYKVTGPYPHSPYQEGEQMKSLSGRFHLTTSYYYDEFGDKQPVETYVPEKTLSGYPNLFQPLPWYADRKPEDMPEYVKFIEYDRRFFVYHSDEDPIPEDYPKLNTVLKLGQDFQWIMTDKISYAVLICEQGYELFADTLAPATHDEYLTYKNKNNG